MDAEQFVARRHHWREPVAILLVEDDAQFAELVRAQLRRMPWVNSRLEVAGTLAAALARLRAEPFGLVISDLALPDSRDLDTLAALTAAGDQPVIVLTGDSDPALRAGALAAGAYDLLSKDNLSAAALERLVRLASIQAGTSRLVRDSEARFRTLLRLSTDFFWETDAAHRVIRIEHGPGRHPAVDPAQIGRARWELPSTWPDAEGWAAHRATLDAHQPFRDFEIARRGANGAERWRSLSGEPVFGAAGAFQGYRGVGRDITAQKRAEEALQRFRLAMDESADMIVLIDRASMRFVDVNRTACALLGYSREELLALGPQDVLPLSRAELERAYDGLIAEPARASGMNSHYRCRDGSLLPFESTRRVLRSRDGWIIAAISRDIRQRISTEKALRESEARFRSLSELSSDWFWQTDAEHRFVHTPARVTQMTGMAAQAYVGKARWEIAGLAPLGGDWRAHREVVARRESFRDLELVQAKADGSRVYMQVSGEPVYDEAGRFAGYRGVGRDITERKREEDLRRLEHAVTRCLAEASGEGAALLGVLQAICETEHWDCGRYLAVDEDAGVLRHAASWLAPDSGLERFVDAGRDLTWPPGMGISGQVWQSGEPLWVADVAAYRGVRRRVFGPESGMRGAFAFPVSAGGRTIGVLIFDAREVRAPLERLLQATRVIGSQVGQYLQRRRAEDTSHRLSAMYVALGAANEAILRAASAEEVFERVCRIAVDAGGFLLGTVFLVERGASELKRVAESGVAAGRIDAPSPSLDESRPNGRGLVGLACRSGEPAISNDYATDPRIAERRVQPRGHGVGSAAVFPLRVEGELAGVFAVQHAERGVFTGELTGLLQRLADNIAFALENFRGEARQVSAKRELSESEQRFRSLTQLSADVYWEQDEQYRFTSFSDSVRRPNAVAPNALLGKRRWELPHVNMTPADWQRHIAQLDARQPFHDLELCHLVAGRRVWISTSGEPVFDADGRFKGYRGIVKDISERKRAGELRELEHSVTRSLAESDSAPRALEGAIRTICLSEGWECGRYFGEDAKAGVVRFSVGWGIADETVQRFLAASAGAVYPPGVGLAGRAWQSGEALWVPEVRRDPRVFRRSLARDSGMQGAFVFPVSGGGRPLGVLAFNSRAIREPEEALLQAIQVVGSQIGQFLQRKQAEQEVRESEARFRSLTQLSNDWYWEQDAELRFVKFEGRGGDPGYAPAAAVLGRRVWDLPGIESDSADWERLKATMGRHESFRNFAYSYRDADGRRFYVSADGEPVRDATGGFAGYRGTSRDITQQRRDEEELRRFRAAMDLSVDAIYLTDRSTLRFVDVNAAACRGVGYSREQLLAMGPEALLRVPRELLEREYDAVIAEGERGMRSETSYVGGDGRTRWTELHRRALRTGDGWVIVTLSRDITERKAADQRQAEHLRHQERISRFGQSALGKRRPAELIDEAVQNVLEGLDSDAVAYLERGAAEREIVVRALAGVAVAGEGSFVAAPGHPALRALEDGETGAAAGPDLPLAWAGDLRSAVFVPVRGAHGALCVARRDPQPFSAEARNFMQAAASVLSAGLQRIESESRLAYLAQFDSLTGLPNRALLADRFSQMIEIARRHGSALSVLFVDLDEFKMVNDSLGHAGGDELLKEVAVRLQACVRPGDTVARISGDEFAVVLADMARTEDAALVAQKIIDRLGAGFDIHGHEAFVTASIGIAAYPGDGADAETLIGAADAAMYRAKQAGRNAFQFFTADINQRTRARAQLGNELRRALEREEFVLFYQPKIDLASGALRGAEALLRWKHPERGLVAPGQFIPVLEETGLIVPVGEWVLRKACADLKAWQAAGLAPGPVAVNLSARQFRLQDLHARIAGIVREAGVDPALVELEITESQLMQDPDHAIRVMRALREAGMRIAIDDFGTGYSSLSYLTRFPVGALKIDRSFVADVNDDAQDAAIVRTIIEMAHTLGFTVVAEGIETEAQARYLREHGCEQAQGYLFARPMPADELAQRLANSGSGP